MLQEILKQATDKQHFELEQMMFVDKIMNGTLSLEQYKKILQNNYIVHACYENQLFENLNQELKDTLEINKRKKLAALVKDMNELNIDQPKIDCNENKFKFSNNAAILGAMYVLEGATLGGNVIVKRLKLNDNLQQLNLGFHYYQVYGSDLIANWKQFCQVLNTKVNEEEFDTSINSALTMFNYFSNAQKADLMQQKVA